MCLTIVTVLQQRKLWAIQSISSLCGVQVDKAWDGSRCDKVHNILLFIYYLFNIIIYYYHCCYVELIQQDWWITYKSTTYSYGCRQSHLHKSTECTHIVRITKNYYYYERFWILTTLLKQRLRNKASQIKKKKYFKTGSCYYLLTTKAIDGKTSLIKYQMF